MSVGLSLSVHHSRVKLSLRTSENPCTRKAGAEAHPQLSDCPDYSTGAIPAALGEYLYPLVLWQQEGRDANNRIPA